MQQFSSRYNLQREHNRSTELFKGLKENVREQKRRVGVYQAEKRGKAFQIRNSTREDSAWETLIVIPSN